MTGIGNSQHLGSALTRLLSAFNSRSGSHPRCSLLADRRRPGDGSERPVSDGQLPDDDPLSLVLPVANGVA